MIKNLIIGSGPAGLATAMALRDAGEHFELVDVGYDLEDNIEQQVDKLKLLSPGEWEQAQTSGLFPPPATSRKGVEKRLYFGSDFPYKVPDNLELHKKDCSIELSHSLGGFGNVWGAALLPYSKRQLRDWPIDQGELYKSYKNVSRYIPHSAEIDGLHSEFPVFSDKLQAVRQSNSSRYFLDKTARIRDKLSRDGLTVGRARLAVDTSDSASGCRYCGQCLGGCAYGSIFNPRLLWQGIAQQGNKLHTGFYVLELEEKEQSVVVITSNVKTGEIVRFEAQNVFLGAGHFASTKILARSLKQYNVDIPVKDSQYFFFPFLSYKTNKYDVQFTLAESFVELDNPAVCAEPVHMQVYGKNQLFVDTLNKILPGFVPKSPILDRLYLFQGYLPSQDSSTLTFRLDKQGVFEKDTVEISAISDSRSRKVAKKVKQLMRKNLLGFGLVAPGNLVIAPPGRSFHTGGSFPMGGKHTVFKSDLDGRPASYKRVYLVDSAAFPNIPSSTIAISIMANADRIVRSVYP